MSDESFPRLSRDVLKLRTDEELFWEAFEAIEAVEAVPSGINRYAKQDSLRSVFLELGNRHPESLEASQALRFAEIECREHLGGMALPRSRLFKEKD